MRKEDDTVKLTKFTKKGKIEVDIPRDDFFNLMKSIKDKYVKDNEISSKFVKVIPDLEELVFYEERNKEVDTPFVVLFMLDNKKRVIRIPRRHTIIWGILNRYTEKE